MKVTAQPFPQAALAEKSAVALWSDLFKARLTGLVVLTTLAGFYMGAQGAINFWLLFHTLVGTALVACGAAALNQWREREFDALMPRTQDRPLPSGAIRPEAALAVGAVIAVVGLVLLALAVNPLTGFLAALTLGIYLFVYTPLKRVTVVNTAIGAVPGALPPLMGWTAARGEITEGGVALFAIQFFWQIPHFLAIAWLYRDQYARAGFVMLPVVDETGRRTARQAMSRCIALVPVSLCPALFGLAGQAYFWGALALSGAFLGTAILFSRELTQIRARQMFFASLLYLPLLVGLMALDKIRS